jgi:hypothetical protein
MLMSTGAGVTWVNSFTGNISTSQVAFASGPNSLTGVSTFVLTSTGLGVNTSVPLSNLHVRGGIANSAVLRVDGTSGLLFQTALIKGVTVCKVVVTTFTENSFELICVSP